MFRFSRLFVLIGFFITVALCHHASAQDSIIVRRAAFDIGSAAIKCVIADVDIVSGRVVKVVKDLTQKVDFAEDLARSYDGNFSKEIMKEGLEALRKFKLVALERSVREWSAVSGAAFQKARNGRAYCVTIQDETGIPCRISSEQQAAMLSYHAVRLGLKMPDDSLLVWDIGGGSAHMTTRNLDGSMTFHADKLASVSFKNVVIEKIKGQDINVVSTPNPMNEEEVQRALQLVESHMEMTVRQSLAERVAKDKLHVVGIGGVFSYAVPEMLGGKKNEYTLAEVEAGVKEWTGKSNADFKSEYASSRLTNLILIMGTMKTLGINRFSTLNVNQADGLLVAPEFW
ncbi:hypothetical protein [uncultured Pseudodesulfovibrio sp.]|uniref:Ppx/GppA phosphatase family protein n=1 Tax=uncultured Pseudodesulfovibrio sp. TaxID=2035858 RepID=UPI0029C77A30|nr:hypothetical protein [uncultured Pseudodesulfovibrio sp.]